MRPAARLLLLAFAAGFAGSATRPRRFEAQRILRISRVVADLERATQFYVGALGFRVTARTACDHAGRPATQTLLRLGDDEVALVQFRQPGAPYPAGSRSNDLWFQHLAIVTSDIDAACRRLAPHRGWQPISEAGPQTLPPANGRVQAYKFRDPDGHPLEFIHFPPGLGRAIWQRPSPEITLGIDHSALAIAATRASLAFYRRLGLQVAARSRNQGFPQSQLDGLPDARLRVTSLRPVSPDGPGLELLAYQPPGRAAPRAAINDLITDWVTLAVTPSPGRRPRLLRDPDGHRLVLVAHGAV